MKFIEIRFFKLFLSLVLIIPSILMTSCLDDILYDDQNVPEGEPTTLSVKVTLSDFQLMTRTAGIDPDGSTASTINDIWVGVYSVNGKRTGMQYETVGQVFSEHELFRNITLNAKSGRAYIVAVANVNSNNGVNIANNNKKSLKDLLDAADTWDAFKNIAYLLEDPQLTQRFNTLVMSGIYLTKEGHGSHLNDSRQIFTNNFVSTADNPAVAAVLTPGTANLDGAIHLRRMSSYVKVNIKASQFIDFTPISWQVCNLPGAAFLNERHDKSTTGRVNAADKKLSVFSDGLNHHNSLVYEASTFETDRTDGITYSFDFYQLENKHAGLSNVSKYDDRELEIKSGGLNSGWYSSLVDYAGEIPAKPAYDSALANNNASYMVIKGKMEYYYEPNDPECKPVNPAGRDGLVRRFADAVYTVHLGYCEGSSENEKARDFNCRRNTKYTYNIEILGADKIRVEASKSTDDPQPGVEGNVTDLRQNIFNIDSHYGVINIALTEQERKDLIWRIQAPFNGEMIDMINGPADKLTNINSGIINLSDDKNTGKRDALKDNQFYNWIQIVPLRGHVNEKDVKEIADYPGDLRLIGRQIPEQGSTSSWWSSNYDLSRINQNENGRVWYLEDLRDPEKHPHPDKKTTDGDDTKYWYTLFIDEYVYEYIYNKNIPRMTGENVNDWKNRLMPLTQWGAFVNEDNRNVWICLQNMNVSNDLESVYSDAVYLISQESIQTFYSEDAVRGIGVESTNESYVNDVLTFKEYNGGNYDQTDGYLNQYRFAMANSNWNVIQKKTLQEGFRHEHGNPFRETYYIPQHDAEFMTSCMARNRDLNGNGTIEINEIRWYLPTDATYTRIILGGVSLRTPLFNLNDYLQHEIVGGTGTIYSHYGASNKRKTWAEEFTSTGVLENSGIGAGTLRCIRNLGQATYLNPSRSDNGYSSIDQAYSIDTYSRTITLNYYQPTALREPTSGHLPAHDVSSPYNRAARRFQYANADCSNINPQNNNFYVDNNGYIRSKKAGANYYEDDQDNWTVSCNYNYICREYSESWNDRGTWRVPNITELAIMTLLEVPNMNTAHLSCTTEYFDRGTPGFHRYLGSKIRDRLDFAAVSKANLKLRCVKDVY